MYLERSLVRLVAVVVVVTWVLRVDPIACQGRGICADVLPELIDLDGAPHVFCLMQPDDGAGGGKAPIDGYRNLFVEAAEGIYRSLPGGRFIDANPAQRKNHWAVDIDGDGLRSASIPGAAIPEPATKGLLTAASALLAIRARRS